MSLARAILRIVCVATCVVPTTPGQAQVEAFRFDPGKVPVGHLFEYVKSNRDGSRPGRVSLYVAAHDRIESLKWSPGDTSATLVVAILDWQRFSARRLEGWALSRGRQPQLRATLEADFEHGTLRISLDPERPVQLRAWPWHSYDFDFATLNLAMPHLRQAEDGFSFQRADITYADTGAPFADMGAVRVEFVGREDRGGRPVRRYAIGGAGLQDQSGFLWAAVDGGYFIEYELPIPDEPGYADARLRLEATRRLPLSEWANLKRFRAAGTPSSGEPTRGVRRR